MKASTIVWLLLSMARCFCSDVSKYKTVEAGGVCDILSKYVYYLNDAAEKGEADVILKSISKEYLRFAMGGKVMVSNYGIKGEELERDFNNGMLSDFNFYRVKSIKTIYLNDSVGLVQAEVTLKHLEPNKFFDPHGGMGSPIASDWGGIGTSSKKIVGDNGYILFEFVREGVLWKLHYCYLSPAPVDLDGIDAAFLILKNMACHPKK